MLIDHNLTFLPHATHVALPEERLLDLDVRLPEAVAEFTGDKNYVRAPLRKAPAAAPQAQAHDLSGLADLNRLHDSSNPWFRHLLVRAQNAARGLVPMVDVEDPTHEDLTGHLAPQLAAMLLAAHPLMARPDGKIYPELRATLESLVKRLEDYHTAVHDKTAERLIVDGTRALHVSALMPDPVLR